MSVARKEVEYMIYVDICSDTSVQIFSCPVARRGGKCGLGEAVLRARSSALGKRARDTTECFFQPLLRHQHRRIISAASLRAQGDSCGSMQSSYGDYFVGDPSCTENRGRIQNSVL